jgi:hypothetical protein
MLNLNVSRFLPSPRKIFRTLFFEKKKSNTHKECFKKQFWPNFFTKYTLGTNVHQMYECDKNQMPYYNVFVFKKCNFEEFWAIDRIMAHIG